MHQCQHRNVNSMHGKFGSVFGGEGQLSGEHQVWPGQDDDQREDCAGQHVLPAVRLGRAAQSGAGAHLCVSVCKHVPLLPSPYMNDRQSGRLACSLLVHE